MNKTEEVPSTSPNIITTRVLLASFDRSPRNFGPEKTSLLTCLVPKYCRTFLSSLAPKRPVYLPSFLVSQRPISWDFWSHEGQSPVFVRHQKTSLLACPTPERPVCCHYWSDTPVPVACLVAEITGLLGVWGNVPPLLSPPPPFFFSLFTILTNGSEKGV